MSLPAGIQYGDVYSIFDYEFADGSVADSKYFVVMGSFKGQIAGFLTTSQEKGGRQRKEGCKSGSGRFPWNYFIKIPRSPFSDGTWVLMQIEWHDGGSLAQKVAAGKAARAMTFNDNSIRAFRNCFQSSPDWSPICAQYMYGGKA